MTVPAVFVKVAVPFVMATSATAALDTFTTGFSETSEETKVELPFPTLFEALTEEEEEEDGEETDRLRLAEAELGAFAVVVNVVSPPPLVEGEELVPGVPPQPYKMKIRVKIP